MIDFVGTSPSLRKVLYVAMVLLDFLLSVKAAPHECVIRTGQF